MKKHILALLSLITQLSYAYDKDIQQLTEVTAKNKAQCIEYFEIKDKLFCSLQPLLNTQIAKEINDAETFKLNLNQNEWKVGWTSLTPEISTIEYIPHGQDIHNWRAMITTQFFPNFPATVSPKTVALKVLSGLQEKGFNPSVSYYAESNDEIIFEFQIFSPAEQAQDEIQRIIKSPKGMHIVHYTIKQSDMGEKERDKWLTFIKDASLK